MAFNPRWKKEWIPLFTQQLRVRNLNQVLGYNVRGSAPLVGGMRALYYFTLHLTSKSAPFYSSESCAGPNPKWSELNLQTKEGISLSGTGLVVRIWQCGSPDQLVTVWGLHLTGLRPVPSNQDLSKELGPNSLVFILHGCSFVSSLSTSKPEPVTRLGKAPVHTGMVRSSYTLNDLLRLQRLQQVISKQSTGSEKLKQNIQQIGPYPPSSLPIGSPNLRYQVHQLLAAREEARHRVSLLRAERTRHLAQLADLRRKASKLEEATQENSSVLSVQYTSLSRETDRLRDARHTVAQTRDAVLHTMGQLANRRRQLVSQLKLIYPITEDSQGNIVKICDVPLVSSEALSSQDESSSAIALGFAAHATMMVATFLDVPLRYPIIAAGSRARVWDLVAPKLPDSEREFPLFSRGRDKLQFNYAVYLLNKDIAQLRWYCGLPTRDLRATLLNLRDLLNMRTNQNQVTNHKRSLSGSSYELASSLTPLRLPTLQPQTDVERRVSDEKKQEANGPEPLKIGGQNLDFSSLSASVVNQEIVEAEKSMVHTISLPVPEVKPKKISGSLESGELCFMEPPVAIERYQEKETVLSCSLDQGLDTLKLPRPSRAYGLLASSKAANSSEPSLNSRLEVDKKVPKENYDNPMPLKIENGDSKSLSSDSATESSYSQNVSPLRVSVEGQSKLCVQKNIVANKMPVDSSKNISCQPRTGGSKSENVKIIALPCDESEVINKFQDSKSSSYTMPNIEKSSSFESKNVGPIACEVSCNLTEECFMLPSASINSKTDDDEELKRLKDSVDMQIASLESDLTKMKSMDSLFASVASRTEALASKSGSFNLVKPRASTLES